MWVSTSADIPSMKSGWIAGVSKRPGLQIAPLFSQALGCRAFLVDVKATICCHVQQCTIIKPINRHLSLDKDIIIS